MDHSTWTHMERRARSAARVAYHATRAPVPTYRGLPGVNGRQIRSLRPYCTSSMDRSTWIHMERSTWCASSIAHHAKCSPCSQARGAQPFESFFVCCKAVSPGQILWTASRHNHALWCASKYVSTLFSIALMFGIPWENTPWCHKKILKKMISSDFTL